MRPDKCLTCSGSKSLHSDSIPERSFYDAADILAKKSNSWLSIRVVLFLIRAITHEIFFLEFSGNLIPYLPSFKTGVL